MSLTDLLKKFDRIAKKQANQMISAEDTVGVLK